MAKLDAYHLVNFGNNGFHLPGKCVLTVLLGQKLLFCAHIILCSKTGIIFPAGLGSLVRAFQ